MRIEWPSGFLLESHGASVKQRLTVTEPVRLQVLGPGAFRIQSWKGMAFEVQASTGLKQWSSVTNLTGTLEFTDSDAANFCGASTERFFGSWKASPLRAVRWALS